MLHLIFNQRDRAVKSADFRGMARVWIPLEIYIFILNVSLLPRFEQVSGANVNEIKHDH